MIARKLCSRRAVIWWSDIRNHLFNRTLLQKPLYSLLSLHVCVHVSLPFVFLLSLSLSLFVWVSFTHTEVASVSSWIFLSQVLCTELATTCCPLNCRTRGAGGGPNVRGKQTSKQEELVVKGKNEEAQRWRQAAAAAETKQPSVLHTLCVCVCVNASVLVSLPLLSALDETKKITVTEERSHGWMKKLLWQSPAVSWKPYSDKSPAVSWERWKFYSDKVQHSHG